MPTTYQDQGYPVDAFNLAVPQTLTVQSITLTDQNDDGLINTSDFVNGIQVTAVYRGDTITVNGVQITGATIYLQGGGRIFTATDGSVMPSGTATSSTWVFNSTNIAVNTLGPICFARGTRLRAERGEVPVEELEPGDLVVTRDAGLQPVRWVGTKVSPGTGKYAPVRIGTGALGAERDLYVSQQHRILLRGPLAEAMFDAPEVLAAAKHLCDGDMIRIEPRDKIEYVHVLFDGHQIVAAEGVWSESFHPGDTAFDGDADLREELFALFPEMADVAGRAAWALRRPELRAFEARALAAALTRAG